MNWIQVCTRKWLAYVRLHTCTLSLFSRRGVCICGSWIAHKKQNEQHTNSNTSILKGPQYLRFYGIEDPQRFSKIRVDGDAVRDARWVDQVGLVTTTHGQLWHGRYGLVDSLDNHVYETTNVRVGKKWHLQCDSLVVVWRHFFKTVDLKKDELTNIAISRICSMVWTLRIAASLLRSLFD